MSFDLAPSASDRREEKLNLAYLRKESLDIFNRLHSVAEDIAFINQVQEAYANIPLLPNLRCGAWYANPAIAVDIPAYFKSTDGHFGNWSFNLRRANLHLLQLLANHSGITLVDSTRSGKRIPDALSKTVPIWCAVINRAIVLLHPDSTTAWDTNLYTPPGVVSGQEHHQISQRLDGWAEALAKSSYSLPELPCPLRPVWITPSTSRFPSLPRSIDNTSNFLPVICVSASKQVQDGIERRSSGFTYIQGSGDDHELWGMELTPEIFWRHRDELLAATRSELHDLVSSLVAISHSTPENHCPVPPSPIVKIGGRILLCTSTDLPILHHTRPDSSSEDIAYLIVEACHQEPTYNHAIFSSTSLILRVECPTGKKGQTYFLQNILPQSMAYIQFHLSRGSRICIACDTGKDTSVGIALAALQNFFDDSGSLVSNIEQCAPSLVNKQSIRTRLEWIISSRPQANPSRATLKRVNEFFLSSVHSVSIWYHQHHDVNVSASSPSH